MSLFLFDAFNLCYALKCLVASDAAADAVNCVCREDYNTIILETFKNHLNVSRIRVFWMYL